MSYPTYEKYLEDLVKEKIAKHAYKVFNVVYKEDDLTDEQWDISFGVECDVMQIVHKCFEKMSVIQCWNNYNEIYYKQFKKACKQFEEEEKREKQMLEDSRVMWDKYFPEIKTIGKLTVDKSRGFIEKLKNIIPTLTKEEVNIMKKFPPKNGFSNQAELNFDNCF